MEAEAVQKGGLEGHLEKRTQKTLWKPLRKPGARRLEDARKALGTEAGNRFEDTWKGGLDDGLEDTRKDARKDARKTLGRR